MKISIIHILIYKSHAILIPTRFFLFCFVLTELEKPSVIHIEQLETRQV